VHSLLHIDLARTLADDRSRAVPRAKPKGRPDRAPPRRWAAHAAARLAARLDTESARRAIG